MILNQIYKVHSKMYKKVADIFVRIKSQISELFKQNFYSLYISLIIQVF